MFVLVGTIDKFGGAGIGLMEVKQDKIRLCWSDHQLHSPNWIHRGPQGRLFATCGNMPSPLNGGVAEIVLRRDGLEVLSLQASAGTGACFLEHSPDGRSLLCANYNTGSLAVFPILEKGLGERSQLIQHEGKGVHPTRQESAHVHQVTALSGSGNRFCVVDLGLDALVVYEQDEEGLLSEMYKISVPAGQGPRHICYGSKGEAYLVTELGNRVYPVRFGDQEGSVIGEGVSTLENADTPNTASALWISAEEGRIYVSNRGEGSIASFNLPDLSFAGRFFTAGKAPRDFRILEKGLIMAACQDQGVSLYRDGKMVDVLDYPGAVSILPVSLPEDV